MKIYFGSFLSAFFLSLLFCIVEIPLLKRLNTGQNILSYVSEHKGKSGTPTMGGIAFIFASSIVALITGGVSSRPLLVSIAIGVGFGIVGFTDDYLKKKHKQNLGLTALQKILFQTSVAILACLYAYFSGFTIVYIPFTDLSFSVGWWIIPLGLFVFLATVNSVNLTDGLDGLAGASSLSAFLSFGLLILLQGQYDFIPVSLLCFALVGALSAFLLFNTNRASMFMGDTGALSLGGFLACVAVFSGNLFYIPVVGIMFVLSSITVILQVIYYKKTGKRLFKMTPIHHHFQRMGYSESKISYAYGLVTLLLGVISLFPYL